MARGELSSAQLETVVYANQRFNGQLLQDGCRPGFFLGDGAGVGKGAVFPPSPPPLCPPSPLGVQGTHWRCDTVALRFAWAVLANKSGFTPCPQTCTMSLGLFVLHTGHWSLTHVRYVQNRNYLLARMV